MLKKLLFRIAKSPCMGRIVGLAFRWCSWALPVEKRYCSDHILAFVHPCPSYQEHLILSPRKPVRDLMEMAKTPCSVCFSEVWKAVLQLTERPEYRQGFTLVANGGRRQEVKQVHFHLFAGHRLLNRDHVPGCDDAELFQCGKVHVFLPNAPEWELQFILAPFEGNGGEAAENSAYFHDVLQALLALEERYALVEKGYSLLCEPRQTSLSAPPVFHIIAGKKV